MKTSILFVLLVGLGLMSMRHEPLNKIRKKHGLKYIPSGSFTHDNKAVSVQAFFMSDHEVTNAEYRSFIESAYLSKGDTIGAKQVMPDTLAWLKPDSQMMTFATLYHAHPAYDNYPAVNISKESAEKYCIWLTKEWRKMYPEEMINDVRLPTKLEWIYAAKGGLKNSPYPWGGPYTRNTKGCYLANFKINEATDEINSIKDKTTKMKSKRKCNSPTGNGTDILSPSNAYYPNGYGLYNMAGNASELVANENIAMGGNWNSSGNNIQVVSQIKFEKANPAVGFRPVLSYIGK